MKKSVKLYTSLFVAFIIAGILSAACGTSTSNEPSDTLGVTGIVEILHPGTRSETYIITDSDSGETFALVGEMVYEIVPEVSRQTAVIGRITEEGYSVREELRKLFVIDFSATQEGDY